MPDKSETDNIIIPDMRKTVTLGDMVSEVTDQALLSRIIESARYYSDKTEQDTTSKSVFIS